MADDKNKLELNIRASINTDTIEQDFKNFDDPTAPLISNTGIERDGGITNIYETETEYTEAGQHIITDDGKDISIVDSATTGYKVIKIDGKPIGQASSYGVEKQLFIEAADDVFLDTNSYTVCSLIDNVITVTEYDYNQVQLNTRDITFTNLANVLTFFTSLSFVRYNGMKYADSLEWALRLGDQVVILQESDPGVTVSVALQSSNVLGGNSIYTSIVYNNILVVAGNSGKIGSFDGTSWKNADGSGTGVGIYNSGDATLGVVGSNNIYSLYVYTYLSNTYLVVGGVGGRVGSWNGTSWIIWSSGGTISNNATAISTDTVTCMTQSGNYLVIAGSVGKLASWNGTTWTNYNVAGVSDNATLIGAVSINTMCLYTDVHGDTTLVVGGASGRIGSMKIQAGTNWTSSSIALGNNSIFSFQWIVYGNGTYVAICNTTSTTAGIATSPDGINWTFQTTTAPGGNWASVTYGNGLFVAIALTTSTTAGIATSTDGVTWTFQTTTAPGGNWASVAYGNGLFVAVAGTTSTTAGIATSTDGVTWTFRTTPALSGSGSWSVITYGNGLFVAATSSTSTTDVIATSSNGITWTFQNLPTASGSNARYATYSGGLYIITFGIVTNNVVTSPDGVNWTFNGMPNLASNTYIVYSNNLFIATTTAPGGANAYGYIFTSPDCINWTSYPYPSELPPSGLKALFANNKVFVTLISSPRKYSHFITEDMVSLNFVTASPSVSSPITKIIYANGIYIGITASQYIYPLIYSYDSVNWLFSNTDGGMAWNDIVYGNGLFVAVVNRFYSPATDSIATSTDGINWTFQTTTAPGGNWRYVTYGNGLFVAVASTTSTTAGIATSPDGVTWTFQTTTAPGGNWASVAYGNGLFVAVAGTTSTTAGIATSTDGVTWTFRTTTAPGGNWRYVTYGNGLFVAIALTTSTTAGIATSTNGTTWTFRTTTAPGGNWISVAYGNGLFVAVAGTTSTTAGIATSTDGTTWTFRTTTAPPDGWDYISYANGTFFSSNTIGYNVSGSIFTSISNTTQKLIYTSASTSLYPTNNGTVIGANAINATAQFNDQLVVAGAGGLLGSFDGLSWKNYNQTGLSFYDGYNVRLPSYPSGVNWGDITYGNGLFVAVAITTSTTTGIVTSPDGINWTFQTTTAPGGNWQSITYGNGLFIAVAGTTSTTAGIATSPDGINWTFQTTTAPAAGWRSVTYGNGLFVAVSVTTSTTAGIATSPDGINWTFQTTTAPGGSGWWSVTYGNGLFVVVALTTSTTAGIATSPDGINWTFRTTTAPGGNWRSITYGNGLFVAVAETTSTTAGIATSTDGTTWTFRTTTAPGGNWISVAYGNGLFVAVALTTSTTAGIATSPDGVTWTFQTTTAPGGQWQDVAYGNGLFVFIAQISFLTNTIFTVKQFYTDNATLIGSNAINSLQIFDNKLAVAGVGGRLGSFNSDASKVIYTAGSGISSNATIIGANDIQSLVVYNSQLIASGVSSTVNSMSTTGAFTPFYNDGGTVVANLLTGYNSLGYLYIYRYENGYYHINLTGNSLNKAYTLDNSTKNINTINCRYSIPQVSNGVTRHIVSSSNVTARPIYDGSNIKCTGLVGYTDFATFSGTVQYPPAAYTLGNGNVLQSTAGFGYSDFTFRLASSATNVYNYVPQFQQSVSGLYQVVQSNSNILVNAYGKLTNNLNLSPTKPFEFRVGMINGVQAYLSAAILDGIASDTLGTIITNVGEFDDTYSPMIKDDDKILYLYNNKHIITKIGTAIIDRIQKVDSNIYKINSISPLNIVDPSDNSLRLGSMDYNGRMLFTSSVAPTISTKIASVIQGRYSNSIDVGDKLVTIVSPTVNNVEIIGYRVPVVSTSVGDYAVDTYFNDIYSYSTLNDGSELIVSSKVDTVYVATTILPVSLGVEYKNGTAQTSGTTIFLKPLYDGYSVGNDITGNYDSFILFGQLYLFDGSSIYLATVDEVNGIFSNKTKVTSAIGLKYLAVTATEAYFYSSFDNSLYTFSGGRDLNKFKRMNRKPIINSGVYSTVDNTLLFDTNTSFIWVRDNIITENIKGSAQTNLKYYSTTDGIIIGNDASKWQYTYYPLTGSVIVPLSIQTSYYGFNLNDKSILSAWVITIYNENKDATNIKGTCYIIDDDTSRQQPINWTINPRDYVDGGYARIRVQPENQRSLGTSLKLETNSKIILVSVVPEFIKGETAVVAKARSR